MVDGISVYDLEDCINDVYEVALRKKNLEKHPNIHGWLNNTAKNIAKRFLRKKAFNRITIPMSDIKSGSQSDFEPMMEDDKYFEELLIILSKNLKVSEYTLFKLKFIEQRPNKELAEIMRIKQDSVGKKVSRLKEKIRNILRDT
jgi:RNA polymerase sigma factor (sigma-70 family)